MKNMRFIFIFSIILVLINPHKLLANDYYLVSGGNPTVLANWGINTDGTGTAPTTFTSASDIWWVANNTNVTLSGSWNVNAGAQVIIGDGVSTTTLVISGSGDLPNFTPIVCNTDCVLDIENNYAYSVTNIDGSNGTVILGNNAIDIPAGMSFLNLVINDDITFAQVTVNGTLTIGSGRTLSFDNTGILSLTAAHITGAGEINGGTGATNAVISLNGTGGTLRTTSGSRIKTLTINLSNNTDVLALGSNLRIDLSSPTFNLTRGILSLGANSFTNNGVSVFNANGSIAGTSTSTLLIAGSSLSSITGNLLMSTTGNTLGALIMSRSTKALTLGNTFNITNLVTATAGTIASGGNLNVVPLAGSSATIGQSASAGAITGNFSVTGTSTSTLAIADIGSLTGSMFMASGSASLSALNLNANGKTLTLGNTLNMMDYANVTAGTLASGGNLNLVASNGRIGSIGPIGAGGSITGNVVVNSFFPSGNTNWALIGSNGVTGLTINDLQTKFALTCSNCNITPGQAGGFTSVQGWDEATCTYNSALTTASSFTPGLGYWVYLGNSSPGTMSGNMSWSFTGNIQTGVINLPTDNNSACGATSGFNLLANPYPCSISWTSLFGVLGNNAAVADKVYTYNRSNGSDGFYQSDGTNQGSGTDVIAPGQGFFVENAAFGFANLTFNETVKSTNNTVNLQKGASGGKTALNNLNAFRLNLIGANDKDDAVFKINAAATMNHDKRYDAVKMFVYPSALGGAGSAPKRTTISSKDPNGLDLAINTFPASNNNVSIPVLVKVKTSGTYTLQAADFDNFQSCIVIKDKLTGVVTDLKIKDYVFTINDTTSTPRFEIMLCASGNSGPLSVSDFFASSNLSINQDADGVIVRSSFKDNTKSIISVYNIVGQKIIDDIEIEGTQTSHLNINAHNQVVLIKVVNDKESLTKKIMLH